MSTIKTKPIDQDIDAFLLSVQPGKEKNRQYPTEENLQQHN